MKNLLVAICLTLIGSHGVHSQVLKDTFNYISLAEAVEIDSSIVFALDLSKSKLRELPDELKMFTNLKALKLSKNKLTELPEFFKTFDNLEYLYLNKNKFTYFPHQVFHLSNLVFLDISRNKITNIPAGIKSLDSLSYLDVWDTRIKTFPEELTELKKLQYLDTRGITFSPSFVEKWTKKMPNTVIKFDKPCNCLE